MIGSLSEAFSILGHEGNICWHWLIYSILWSTPTHTLKGSPHPITIVSENNDMITLTLLKMWSLAVVWYCLFKKKDKIMPLPLNHCSPLPHAESMFSESTFIGVARRRYRGTCLILVTDFLVWKFSGTEISERDFSTTEFTILEISSNETLCAIFEY